MHDLSDVSFLLPYRKDSEQRLRNLKIVTSYLTRHFNCHVMVTEDAAEQTFFEANVDYYKFQQNNDAMFHRTKILNDMVKATKSNIICLYDTDVLIGPDQYINTAALLRSNTFDMIYPYDGRFYNIDRQDDVDYIQSNLSLDSMKIENCTLYHPNSVGGCVFFRKDAFIRCGYENEYFLSWGFEDNSRLVTHQKLGSKVSRVPGVLYHLNHPTSGNSSNTASQTYSDNQREFHKIANMSPDQLRYYIKTWEWTK